MRPRAPCPTNAKDRNDSQARETADQHNPAGRESEGDETVSDAIDLDDRSVRADQAPADAVRTVEVNPGTGRVEAFSDGVFAVAMTLLALNIRVPHVRDNATFAAAAHSLAPVGFEALSFTLSFIFVVVVWVNHHQIFHALHHTDRGLMWWNASLLFWICLLPFPTAFVGEYPRLPLATMLLSGVLCGGAIAFLLLVRHADAAALYRDEISAATRSAIMKRCLVGPPAFVTTALIAIGSPTIALVALFAVMGYFFLPSRVTVVPPMDASTTP